MGNNNVTYAKSSEPAPGSFQAPPLTAPLPPQPVGEKTNTSAPAPPATSAAPVDKKLSNPGLFEELHKKAKEVHPQPLDGFRLVFNKGLSNHFQVTHSLNLSNAPNGANYHFGATYVGGKQTSPTDATPVILGDIDNTGSLMAQIIHQFTDRIKGKCVIQTQQKEFAVVQMDADYAGDDCTAACTLGNIDLLAGSGIVVSHYLQRITKNIDLGAECLYHYSPGEEKAVLSFAGRYTSDPWVGALQFNPKGWHASYYHKGIDNVAIGVDYEYSSHLQESTVSLGYQIDIPKASVTVRGMLDTNWTVAAVFEKRLQPLPLTFCLSGMLNHAKNQSRFGFALQFG